MNRTIRWMSRDLIKLREEAGLTQQQLADLAGEPCRTFIAHIEQERPEHVNLEKMHSHLHVLFTIIKRKRLHGSVLSPRQT